MARMTRLTKSLSVYLQKNVSFYNDLRMVLNKVPTEVIIYCICLGKSLYQRTFLYCLIYFLKPKHVYIYDKDWKHKEYLDQFKDITTYLKDINPQCNLGSNILLYSPYCPFTTPILTLIRYNLKNLFRRFYYIGIPGDTIIRTINDNLEYISLQPSILDYLKLCKVETPFQQGKYHEFIGKSLITFNHNPAMKGFEEEIEYYVNRLPNTIRVRGFIKEITEADDKKRIFTSVELISKIEDYCIAVKAYVDEPIVPKVVPQRRRSKIFEPFLVGHIPNEEDIDEETGLPNENVAEENRAMDIWNIYQSKYTVPEISTPQKNPRYSLWQWWPPIYEQGNVGTCGGNAYCAAYKFMNTNVNFEPSRLYAYYQGKQFKDTMGTDFKTMIDFMSNVGMVSEQDWPYIPSKAEMAPPKELEQKAKPFGMRFEIRRSKQTIINTINFCIAKHIPVLISMKLYKSFKTEIRAGIFSKPHPAHFEDRNDPSDPFLGGHAMVIIGYDDILKRYEIVNSWGPNWGVQGRFFLPYEYILDGQYILDLYVIAPVKPHLLNPLSHMITKFL